MREIIHSTPAIKLTETQMDVLFEQDQGLCGAKDLDGIYTKITTSAIDTVSKKNFRTRQDIIGRSNFETLENQELCQVYQSNESKTLIEHCWVGIVTIFWKMNYVSAYSTILPIWNERNEIIGTFWQSSVIENELVNRFFEQLNRHKMQIFPKSASAFEINYTGNSQTLTRRESECLFFTLRGKTAKSIGKILNVSSKTVEFHLDHLKLKFNVLSKSELISKAIEQGFLEKIPASILKISTIRADNED